VNRTNHWKLGLFVATGLAIGLVAIFWLGFRRLNRDAVPMVTYFDESVQGLDQGSPVKFRGVTLGTVSTITVAPDQRHVEVWMRLYTEELRRMGFDPTAPRDPQLRPQLASAGITGVKFVQLDTFPPERYPVQDLAFAVPERYYIPSVPSTLKSLEEVANEFLAKLPKLSNQVGDALVEAKHALKRLTELASWVKSDESGVKKLVASLGTAADTLQREITRAEIAQMTGAVRAAATNVNGTAVQLGGQSAELEQTLVALRETLEAVRALAARLERDPSSLVRGRNVEATP
jgi:ABC-type transporter Mla subunit MlaD